jgi:NAD(P)H-nitrite reductase large subunit
VTRHVLIGAGPAAIAAAEAIRGVDEDADIVLVVADPHGAYSRPGLAYYLSAELPRARLFAFGADELARLGVRIVADAVTTVDAAAHRVALAGGGALDYDRLLIATGSQAVPARVPGVELDGVVKLDDMDDALDIARRCRRARAAVVVGGGITALEIVEGLRARGLRVHYLMRQDRYWRNVLAEPESRLVEESLRREGVELHHHTELGGIVGRGGRVAAVETSEGATIPCELVAVAIGVRPRLELARSAGLEGGRGIVVDEHLRTSDEHVFAAGDVAETLDASGERRTMEVLWNPAVAKGRTAGLNMARDAAGGPLHTYTQSVALNITRLAGHRTTIVGTVGNGEDKDLEALARGDSQTWSELGPATLVQAMTQGARLRLELGARTIVGAVVMGDQSLSLPLQELVGARADVSALAATLRERQSAAADVVGRFWEDWRAQRGR